MFYFDAFKLDSEVWELQFDVHTPDTELWEFILTYIK